MGANWATVGPGSKDPWSTVRDGGDARTQGWDTMYVLQRFSNWSYVRDPWSLLTQNWGMRTEEQV